MSKLCAVGFITLILLPFTAPFPTYQLDSSGHPYDALPKEFKNKIDSGDGLILPSACRLLVPLFDRIIVRAFLHSHAALQQPVRYTILRL